MKVRRLGNSGLKVGVVGLGCNNFGMRIDQAQTQAVVDAAIDAGITLFDTADIYGGTKSEEFLGKALGKRRQEIVLATKFGMPIGGDPKKRGGSRKWIMQAVEDSLKRLGTDYIDLYQLHGFDAMTPVEEVVGTLDDLVRAGKIRYIGVSNFSGWHLMKSLAASERYGYPRYVAHQAYYSLIGRDYEWELMPVALDQKVGCVVWSPLGWARLTGKVRRGQPKPPVSRLQSKLNTDVGPQVADEYLYKVVDAIDEVAKETDTTRAGLRLLGHEAPTTQAWQAPLLVLGQVG